MRVLEIYLHMLWSPTPEAHSRNWLIDVLEWYDSPRCETFREHSCVPGYVRYNDGYYLQGAIPAFLLIHASPSLGFMIRGLTFLRSDKLWQLYLRGRYPATLSTKLPSAFARLLLINGLPLLCSSTDWPTRGAFFAVFVRISPHFRLYLLPSVHTSLTIKQRTEQRASNRVKELVYH